VLIALLFAALLIQTAMAQQNANLEQGLKPYGSYQGGNVDSVSMTNGNLGLHIPIVSYPQRGGKLRMNFFIRYNNKGWQVQQTGAPPAHVYKQWVWRGASVDIAPDQDLSGRVTTMQVMDQVSGSNVWVHMWDVITPDGASHERDPLSSGTTAETVDASGIQATSSGVLVDRDGIRYGATIEDPNGNTIGISSSGWTDTMGRFIAGSKTVLPNSLTVTYVLGVPTSDLSQCPTGTAAANLWNLPGPSGGTSVIKLCYGNLGGVPNSVEKLIAHLS
jgi:hypothetical protein